MPGAATCRHKVNNYIKADKNSLAILMQTFHRKIKQKLLYWFNFNLKLSHFLPGLCFYILFLFVFCQLAWFCIYHTYSAIRWGFNQFTSQILAPTYWSNSCTNLLIRYLHQLTGQNTCTNLLVQILAPF